MSRLGWNDRLGEDVVCSICGETRDSTQVDRTLWCDDCKAATRVRALRLGAITGALVAVLLSIYVWRVIQPTDLVLGGWAACMVAAGWITSKITTEVAFGVFRAFPEHS